MLSVMTQDAKKIIHMAVLEFFAPFIGFSNFLRNLHQSKYFNDMTAAKLDEISSSNKRIETKLMEYEAKIDKLTNMVSNLSSVTINQGQTIDSLYGSILGKKGQPRGEGFAHYILETQREAIFDVIYTHQRKPTRVWDMVGNNDINTKSQIKYFEKNELSLVKYLYEIILADRCLPNTKAVLVSFFSLYASGQRESALMFLKFALESSNDLKELVAHYQEISP